MPLMVACLSQLSLYPNDTNGEVDFAQVPIAQKKNRRKETSHNDDKSTSIEVLLFILLSYYQKNPTHLHHYPQRKQQNCYDWLNWKCKFFNICKFGIAFLIYNIN